MHPLAFLREHVELAIVLWRERPNEPGLALAAIVEIDNLAEFVALDQRGGSLGRGGANRFREDLCQHKPALARPWNIHDISKHGTLDRSSAVEVTKGQRPLPSDGTAIFLDDGFFDDGFFGETSSAVRLDEGTVVDAAVVIGDAMAAWDRELRRLRYLTP